jgi:F0F1-type ATP synthase gamma subunit
MEEFENPQDSQEGWEMMQRLIWTFMMEFTGKNIAELTVAFEKWAENLSQEQMDQIFNPKVEGEPTERNLQEEGPLHSKEDILKSMWSNND